MAVSSTIDKPKLQSLAARLWQYQLERFPLHKHGLLVAAFSFAGMSLSASLRDQVQPPHAGAFLTCFVTTLTAFLMLRIADEHKDRTEDALYRPYLPVPRGLVSLAELRNVFIGCAVIQVAVNAIFSPILLLILAPIWAYMYLMTKEFFAGVWLRKHPTAYLLSHMIILPLIDAYITACDWLPSGQGLPSGLALFLVLSFVNGIVLELGRKIRNSSEEEPGVETYSALWGLKRSLVVWSCAVAIAALFGVLTAIASGTVIMVSAITFLMIIAARNIALGAVSNVVGKPVGRRIETASAMWLLVLYVTLGISPFLKIG